MANTLVGNIKGPQGSSALTTNTSAFTVPAAGLTVSVTVADASWIVAGEMLWVANAGGSGVGAFMRCTAKAGNTLTLLNPA